MTRALLLATSLLWTLPALAFVDPPAASDNDKRLRAVIYDPNNPVQLYAVPGASIRIEFGSDETILGGGVVASDQDIMHPDPNYAPPPPPAVAGQITGNGAASPPPSCNSNMCTNVVGNFLYIKPVRPLDPQPLFVQTQRTDEAGKPHMTAYTFELLTRADEEKPKADIKTAALTTGKSDATPQPVPTIWGVRFIYPDRVKAAQAVAWQRQKRASDDAAHASIAMAHVTVSKPGPDANWRYGYRGSVALQPDQVWDDGRTTFLRYNGNRRVPNVYNQLPDGHESIPAVASEPDETGNTLRIARTETKWFLRDGDQAGCLFDIGPDPDGRTTPAVAMTR
jgi:type IV secretion system protein VirB9